MVMRNSGWTTWGMRVRLIAVVMMLVGDQASLSEIIILREALILWIDILGERWIHVQIFLLRDELLGDLGILGLAWHKVRIIGRLPHW